jgi:hypothetical protein
MRAVIAASVVVMCFGAGLVIAQSRRGDMTGTVTAVEGHVLPGARVTLKGRDTRTTRTDKNGKYVLKEVSRGTYIAGFEFVGYHPTYVKVDVADKAVRLDVVLPVRFID